MRICVDAGHGGADPGAIGHGGYREKEYTLSQAYVFAAIAREEGHEITLTRRRDLFVPLRERARRANASGADVFVSFHFNAAGVASPSGTLVLHHAGSTRGAALAARVLAEVSPLDGELEERERVVGLPDASFRKTSEGRPFVPYVLRATSMPAIIVETEFGTNPVDAALLRSVDYQVLVAEASLRGITADN